VRIAPLLALVLFSAAAHGAPDAEVDRAVAARIDGDRSGACVVAVRIVGRPDGGFAEQRADRCASTARALPSAPGYRLEIGSISKAFTGVLLAEMAERKELSLDDTVQQHLPAGVAMPRFGGPRGDAARPRDPHVRAAGAAARHAPGLATESLCQRRREAGHRCLAQLTLTHPPGERHAYSNWAFMLLSDIAGRRAGKPYDALLANACSRRSA